MTDDQGYSHERALGERIARLRDAAGLPQRELARRMDLSQSALSRIESGQRRLSAAQVSRLARILAVEPGALLDLESPLPSGTGGTSGSLPMAAFESPEAPWSEPLPAQGQERAGQSSLMRSSQASDRAMAALSREAGGSQDALSRLMAPRAKGREQAE